MTLDFWESDPVFDGPTNGDWAQIGKPAHNRMFLYLLRAGSGELLYAGITWNIKSRWQQHRLKRDWWGEVRAATVRQYDGRNAAEALRAIRQYEREAITRMKPSRNIIRPARRTHRE